MISPEDGSPAAGGDPTRRRRYSIDEEPAYPVTLGEAGRSCAARLAARSSYLTAWQGEAGRSDHQARGVQLRTVLGHVEAGRRLSPHRGVRGATRTALAAQCRTSSKGWRQLMAFF